MSVSKLSLVIILPFLAQCDAIVDVIAKCNSFIIIILIVVTINCCYHLFTLSIIIFISSHIVPLLPVL